ncbi:right-handed parallel beta-helix repeat-containing protein [Streptomyces polygonati]|uniref:Right-handed parallel beta-helix repeat-containing protein n=1 Tax=Streptomyces polygonati TaxID=1617087 RepID=A0ABV8I085_9ACTN
MSALIPGLVVALSLPSATAATVGATTPFTSYEGEAGTLGGGATAVSVTAAPTTQYSSAALEASGHAYAQLTGTGQFVRWTNTTGHPVSFVDVRASIPDSASGGGTTATLNLYVDGTFRQALNLNSKQSWLYEGTAYSGQDQNPADGDPQVFFDDAHAFVTGAAVAPGSTITLQKDAANTAAKYLIDVIDVENPPAPITQPANSVSITSCGAVSDPTQPNGSADSASVDSSGAIQTCINQAQSQGKILWIPSGTFYVKGTNGLSATGITIEGAGMWYSTIYRSVPLPNAQGPAALFHGVSTTLENFHLDSNATSRATVDGSGGSMDMSGTDWAVNGVWAQHNTSGIWGAGTGGTVSNSRFTDMWADGVNINNVSNNSSVGDHLTATNNFIRGTGDDGMAINSVNYNVTGGTTTYYTAMTAPTLTNNTVIAVWGAHGIGVYGGGGDLVQNNYIADTARYTGLSVGQFSANGSHLTSATVSGNTIVRSGGNAYNQGQPALRIGIDAPGQSTGDVANATVTGNTIISSVYDAIGISSSNGTKLTSNTITSPWRNGIAISPPNLPAPSGSATITGNTVTGLKPGASAYLNSSTGFSATVSGNSWQGTSGPSGVVSLRAHANSQYVTADNAGASPLIANRTAIGAWESFDLLHNSDGSVSLRAHANNDYVTADNGGAAPLIANRTAIGPWESFDLINNPDGSVSLRAHANNDYVTAENAGAAALIANRTSIGSYEEFDLIND